MKYVLATVGLAACLASTSTHAQWINQKTGGAFDDNPLYVALTVSHKLGFGLRCNASGPQVVFITNDESMTQDTYKLANAAEPKLRVKIDKGEIISLDATLEDTDDGKMIAISDGNLSLYEQIRDAKKSVSVVVTVLGKNFHENQFNVRGAKEAVGKLISGCKLNEAKKS